MAWKARKGLEGFQMAKRKSIELNEVNEVNPWHDQLLMASNGFVRARARARMASMARKPSKPWPILLILTGQLDIHLMKVGMKFQLNISENGHFMTDFRLKMAIFGVY
jgi:hypothetical protein